MIQITRKEQQTLKNLRAVMAAEKTDNITQEMLDNLTDQDSVASLRIKNVIDLNWVEDFPDIRSYSLTKERLQVVDDDPDVEKVWEDFRAVQGNGSMTKFLVENKEADKAVQALEEVLVKKGRLTHLVKDDSHVWATEDKVQYWLNQGYKEGNPTAKPMARVS